MSNIIFTIARQYGSGGKTVGEMLAKDLGINCYNREILRMASDESGISEELFNKADERLKNSPLFGIVKSVYTGQLIPPDSSDFVSTQNLFNYQAKVIKKLADQESCVIIGRCADFVLKDNPNVISIFVYGDSKFCLNRALEQSSLTEKEMEKFISKTDKIRGDYYRYYTGHKWNNARNYDLCLDSSKLGFVKLLEVMKSYARIRFPDAKLLNNANVVEEK